MQQVLARFPGISCAWTDAAGCLHTECHGLADVEQGIPVTEHTIFPACSMAKFVTALLVMKLHEQQRINIDAPVNTALRTWKLRRPDGNEGNATIRHLLCHTAGVMDGEDGFYGLRWEDASVSLLDVLEGRTAYNNRPARTEKAPGTSFEYSDAGYCVLQLLVEDATGMSFADAAKALVFEPLGLENIFFAAREHLADHEACLATGYDGNGQPIPGRYPFQPDLAASALWASPKAMLTLGRTFVAACRGENDFLQQSLAQEIAAPVAAFPWTGLGIFTQSENRLMSQGWGENGQCMLKMNLRTGTVAVVMTNRNPEVDQAESGVEALVDALLQR